MSIKRPRRFFCMIVAVLVACLAPAATELCAQQMHRSYGNARITGTVRDAVSGRMVLRAEACSSFATDDNMGARPCAGPDSSGYFELSGLPEKAIAFHVSCPGRRGFLDRPLLHRSEVALRDSATVRIDVLVDATACDMRPFAIRSGVFDGIYYSAFEAEALVSCDGVVHGWPTFRQEDREKINRVNLPVAVSHTYYMRWEGIFRGPGRFGHLNGSAYGIDVSRVLSVRESTEDDCANTRAQVTRQQPTAEGVHRRWWNAVVSGDTATVAALSTSSLAVTLADGSSMNLAALLARLATTQRGATALWELETSRQLGKDVVVVNAQLTGSDLLRPVILRVQTVLERQRKGWTVVSAQSTPVAVFSATNGYVVQDFDGDYRSERGARVQVWSRDSVLTLAVYPENRDATIVAAGRAKYRPIGPGLFEADQLNADGSIKQLLFARDRSGKVTSMSILSAGSVISYARTH